ncbi:MAG: hypothetical protein AAFY59_16125 [Pseudomonadota bacterium]
MGTSILQIILVIVFIVIAIIPYWKIWSRSGHSGWWSLLMLVPLLNIVMLWVIAFKRWPAEERRADVSGRF